MALCYWGDGRGYSSGENIEGGNKPLRMLCERVGLLKNTLERRCRAVRGRAIYHAPLDRARGKTHALVLFICAKQRNSFKVTKRRSTYGTIHIKYGWVLLLLSW